MHRPTFVFDFDGVIADTSRLKAMIFSNVEQAGFAQDEIKSTYEAVKRDRGGQDPVEFARRLSHGDSGVEQTISAAWRAGELRITAFVCAEMLALVRSMQAAGYPTILLTAGRVEVQKRKVRDSGLDDTISGPFQEIVYVEEDEKGENKIGEINKLLVRHPFIVLFDDQPYNIEPFAKWFARDQILPVFVRIFDDKRNTDYVPPEGVPTLSSVEELNVENILSLLPKP